MFSLTKTITLLSFAVSFAVSQACAADHSYQRAMAYISQGDFEQASQLLAQVSRTSAEPGALYYYAYSLQSLGRFDEALAEYQRLRTRFPNSKETRMAYPQIVALASRGVHVPKGTPLHMEPYVVPNVMPNECRVYYELDQDKLFNVEAKVNGKPVKMVFDTGAETCTFGKNHLREMGIGMPTGQFVYKASGIGDHAPVPTWQVPVDLTVGNITKRHFIVDVQDNLSKPLLGQSFYKPYTCVIDQDLHMLEFKSTKALSANSTYSIPFSRHGDSLLVAAELNGHPITMLFDTGASGISFSAEDIKNVGLSVPEDAIPEIHQGVGGEAQGFGFEVNQLRVGQFSRQNVKVSVVKGVRPGFPLLGQSFLIGWKYTIDNIHSVITFEPR